MGFVIGKRVSNCSRLSRLLRRRLRESGEDRRGLHLLCKMFATCKKRRTVSLLKLET